MRHPVHASALLAVLVLAGCGGAAPESTSHEGFSLARGGGGLGPLLGYDVSSGRQSFALPAGFATANGRLFYAARPTGAGTELRRYDRRTGQLLGSRTYRGRWALGGVSLDGRYVALARPSAGRSEISVVDLLGGGRRVVSLRGRFDVDAVAPDGRTVFLIQHHASGAYSVRWYDLVARKLGLAVLREKGEVEEPEMTGIAAGRIATADGGWLLTLYVNTQQRKAFVHALDLRRRVAICIDLPGEGAGLPALRSYTLAATGEAGSVFAANAALGVIAEVDLSQYGVVSSARLPQSRSAAASALSRDGRTLYVAAGTRLWTYDSWSDRIRGPYAAGGRVTGLTLSADGRTLYAVRGDGTAIGFRAVDGTRLAT
jgi:hypothetical protein